MIGTNQSFLGVGLCRILGQNPKMLFKVPLKVRKAFGFHVSESPNRNRAHTHTHTSERISTNLPPPKPLLPSHTEIHPVA